MEKEGKDISVFSKPSFLRLQSLKRNKKCRFVCLFVFTCNELLFALKRQTLCAYFYNLLTLSHAFCADYVFGSILPTRLEFSCWLLQFNLLSYFSAHLSFDPKLTSKAASNERNSTGFASRDFQQVGHFCGNFQT